MRRLPHPHQPASSPPVITQGLDSAGMAHTVAAASRLPRLRSLLVLRDGYGWFVGMSHGHPLRYAWGYRGQMLFIVPDLRSTVVMTSDPGGTRDGDHIAALHHLLGEGIIPAAELGAGDAADSAAGS